MTDAKRLWDAALGHLQVQVTRANYETWLRGTAGLDYDGSRLKVGVPSDFARQWLADRLSPAIRTALARIEGRPIDVVFVVAGDQSGTELYAALDRPGPDAANAPARAPLAPSRASGLLSRYTFDTFVAGNANMLAFSAARSAAENPGSEYNPLYLYGGVGLGKTHLLHAIGNAILARGGSVLYVSAERFTNDYIRAIVDRTFDDFRSRYRSPDVLLVDDIQFLAGKEQMQEEFFHTFNEMYAAGRQIVLTSDLPPAAISLLEDRLRSRFEWGLTADIQPPDREMRLAILQTKAAQLGIDLPGEIAEIIANRRQRNIRELEGALNQVLAVVRLHNEPLTRDLVERVTASLGAERPSGPPLTPDRVIAAVALFHGLTPEDLCGPSRTKRIADARHAAMYLLREDVRLPLAEIGHHLGGRDHTTVMHGVGKIAKQMLRDPSNRSEILSIRGSLERDSSGKSG